MFERSIFWPTCDRQNELKEVYLFQCKCELCEKNEDINGKEFFNEINELFLFHLAKLKNRIGDDEGAILNLQTLIENSLNIFLGQS